MNSIAHESPIVREVVKQLIQNIEIKNYKTKERHRIDTNIIPKISEKTPITTKELFNESILKPEINIEQPRPIQQAKIITSQPTIQQTNINNPNPTTLPQNISTQQYVSRLTPPPQQIQKNNIPIVKQPSTPTTKPSYGYGKLFGLIHDPGVAYIECYSPNTPIVVIKNGQNQTTNISLSEKEIKKFFEYVSEKSKIPLTEGVFKVIFDGMLLNAIVSDTIGTKFIIKKNIQIGPGFNYV